jgi:hypothetical protein
MVADPLIARYRRAGVDHARTFDTVAGAYDFLRTGVADGDFEVNDIESEAGAVIVSAHAFEELERLDQVQRDGWLAVLSRGLTREEAPSPAVQDG